MSRILRVLALTVSCTVGIGPAFAQTGDAGEPGPAELFKKLDKNSDGALTAGELNTSQQKYFDRLLKKGDKNNDGKLSLQEFTAAVNRKYDPVQPAGGGGRDRLPFSRDVFKRLDKNRDGKLTLEELPGPLRPRFKRIFDRLKKKELTFAEIARAARGQQNPAARRRFAESTFKRLDANKDGKVTAAEARGDRSQNYFRFLLRRSGKDAGGSLTRAEFLRAATQPAPGAQRRPDPAAVLRRFDKNRDGTISKDEAQGGLKTNFHRIDRNSDGKLDRRELAGALRNAPRKRPKD